MSRQCVAIGAIFFLGCSLALPGQKKASAKPIRFQGASQYTQQELLAAAGLKAEARLTASEVKLHAKQLGDTGLFKEIKFSSDSKALTFTLTPITQLFPMHLENVPVKPGADLDAKIRARLPLYRGQLPASGTMVEGVSRLLEETLTAKGIRATVKGMLTSDLGPQKVTAVNFALVSPPVHIGRIQLAGVSVPMLAKASLEASGQTGNSFDTEGTPKGLQRVFEDLYQDQGYAAVQVEVVQNDPVAAADQSLDIPFSVTVKEGGVYKLGTVDLPADTHVKRAEVEKLVAKSAGSNGRSLNAYLLAVCDVYRQQGYLDCAATPRPAFNEATHIVNYSLDVSPGPPYQLGAVKFEGAPDAMATKLKQAWKLAPGTVFDGSYPSGFAAQAQKKDKALAKWLQTVVTTYDVKSDPATHEVTCIFHFANAAQGAR